MDVDAETCQSKVRIEFTPGSGSEKDARSSNEHKASFHMPSVTLKAATV